jgi:hypothetical protein
MNHPKGVTYPHEFHQTEGEASSYVVSSSPVDTERMPHRAHVQPHPLGWFFSDSMSEGAESTSGYRFRNLIVRRFAQAVNQVLGNVP